MRTSDLDYELPEELIAQEAPPERDAGRMLVLRGESVEHRRVLELPRALPARSLLVVNDTRVIPARLVGVRGSGGRVELLLVQRLGPAGATERWRALGRPGKRLRPGTPLSFGDGRVEGVVDERGERGVLAVTLSARPAAPLAQTLAEVGRVPLPPYIRREPRPEDRDRYQTVFAREPGAVAAPTAGLHLSPRLLDALAAAGHARVAVTLHVGPGTFAPVTAEELDAHRMHEERFEVPPEAAAAIAAARADGRPVVAVGTTVARTLESAFDPERGRVAPGAGRTRLFIRPPYRPRVVDALLTNFHLPRSTLLALAMAFGGEEPVRRAYRAAVDARYRFFSYGDAMLILPERA